MNQYQDHAHPPSDQANTRSSGDAGCNHYQLHLTQPVHETIIHLSTCTGTQSVNGEVSECETEPNTNDIIVLLNEFRPPTNRALGTGMVCIADVFFPLSPTTGDRLIGAHQLTGETGEAYSSGLDRALAGEGLLTNHRELTCQDEMKSNLPICILSGSSWREA